MSLAQRRTTPVGINTVSSPVSEEAYLDGADGTLSPHNTGHARGSESGDNNRSSIPVEDGKEFWQALTYDPFGQAGPPQLHHYESFPPDLSDNVGAYEVSTIRRIFQVAFAILACVLASGIVCGFAALKPILIAEGVYSSLCPASYLDSETSKIPCPEQDMRLNLFFITASITLNVATVLAGYVLDNYGRRVCYLLSALILFLGGTCMAAAFHFGEKLANFDGYITGNVLLGLGGTFLFVSSYQLSNAFPRHSGLIVALVTGAFDASAAVFLFYRLAYEASSGRFHPATFFLLFALLMPALILLAEFGLMSDRAYNTHREYQAAIAHAQDHTRDAHDSDDELPSPTKVREHRANLREARLEAIETVTGDADARCADRTQARDRQAASGVQGILSNRSVGEQMANPWFVLLLVLTVAQMTRMNYFIATVRAQYRYLLGGDEEAAERVNEFFDVALPVAGVVTTPFIGVLLNTVPVWATLGVLTGLVGLLGALNCIPGSEAAGYATVVAFVLYRPLYYSAVSDYATKVFGFATFGRIYGTVICVSGLGQLIQPLLDAFTHGPLHENPIPLNIAFAVSGPVIAAALTLYVYIKTRENEAGTEEERRVLLRGGSNSDRCSGH
ncbi:hypothetical protein N0V93_006483 [Gnomoniopsis smithogilvyi]|uniref:MFS transporter n=1 Tax=Gnomoniopsis smithogilvyi TaxID=1191159 RepID=A0A9W8YQV0_9PEZI|nr:hypothetical protein N0V93_006483 [Gnomoniopsis smithogilvyi]